MLYRFIMDVANFGKKHAFEDLPKATKIYMGETLTVSSEARGLGLGKELIRQTLDLAKNRDCSHVYIGASSLYSQRIFKDFNFVILHEVAYDDFLDRDGKTCFFKDMREHKTFQAVCYEL